MMTAVSRHGSLGMLAWVLSGGVPDLAVNALASATGIHARLTPSAGEGDVRARLRYAVGCKAIVQSRDIPGPLAFAIGAGSFLFAYSFPGSWSIASPLGAIAIGPTRPTYQGPVPYNFHRMHSSSTMFLYATKR